MAVLSDSPGSLRTTVGRHGSTLACGLLVLSVLLVAALERSLPLALYLLSFWHYYLYWLAFAFGAAAFETFKRDAILMKAVAVALLATVYLAAPIDLASLAVIAGGILLNLRAASLLGIDRTYYGHEVAGLPLQRITAFPYSLTGHPMILGNIAAFGGTLINPAFRQDWWPLAGLHVGLNIGLLVMELAGPRRRRRVQIAGGLVFTGVFVGGVCAVLSSGRNETAPLVVLGAATVACAGVLYRCYLPQPAPEESP